MVERRVDGTRTSAVDAERSRRRESTSDSGWVNSDRYCGAAPFRQRCSRTQSLYWMRSGTRSQCQFTSSGVTPPLKITVTLCALSTRDLVLAIDFVNYICCMFDAQTMKLF